MLDERRVIRPFLVGLVDIPDDRRDSLGGCPQGVDARRLDVKADLDSEPDEDSYPPEKKSESDATEDADDATSEATFAELWAECCDDPLGACVRWNQVGDDAVCGKRGFGLDPDGADLRRA